MKASVFGFDFRPTVRSGVSSSFTKFNELSVISTRCQGGELCRSLPCITLYTLGPICEYVVFANTISYLFANGMCFGNEIVRKWNERLRASFANDAVRIPAQLYYWIYLWLLLRLKMDAVVCTKIPIRCQLPGNGASNYSLCSRASSIFPFDSCYGLLEVSACLNRILVWKYLKHADRELI